MVKVEKKWQQILKEKTRKSVIKADFNFVLVEELELLLQKEQMVSNDLRSTLEAEKSRGLEQQGQLEAELKAMSVLKAELEETRLKLQSAYTIQEDLKSQIQKLRYSKLAHAPVWIWIITVIVCCKLFSPIFAFLRLKLENFEAERQACLQAVEQEQARLQELQEDVQQQRLNSQQTIEQNQQTQEVIHIFDVQTWFVSVKYVVCLCVVNEPLNHSPDCLWPNLCVYEWKYICMYILLNL